METITVLLSEENTLNHYLAGNDWKNSGKVLCMSKPVNNHVIERYFLDDDEIDTILQALEEKPKILEFDHVFKPSNTQELFSELIEEKNQALQEQDLSFVYVLYSNQLLFSNSRKNAAQKILFQIMEKALTSVSSLEGFVLEALVKEKCVTLDCQEGQKHFLKTNSLTEHFSKKLKEFLLERPNQAKDFSLFFSVKIKDIKSIHFIILPQDLHNQTGSSRLRELEGFLKQNLVTSPQVRMESPQNLVGSLLEEKLKEHVQGNFEIVLINLINNSENYGQTVRVLEQVYQMKRMFEIDHSEQNQSPYPSKNELNQLSHNYNYVKSPLTSNFKNSSKKSLLKDKSRIKAYSVKEDLENTMNLY